MKVFIIYFLLIIAFWSCKPSAANDYNNSSLYINEEITLDELAKRAVNDLKSIAIDSMRIPRTTSQNLKILKGQPSKNWTSGFYPGLLWQLYGHSNDERLKEAAITWSSFVEKEKFDSGTHDLGFKIYCPFGNAYKITKNEKYKDVFIQAAKTLSTRFNPKVGAIRSWDHHKHLWDFPVIIDNMMNLEMLFEATRLTGDSSYYYIANEHASTTLKNHFRSDNSSYHVIDYNSETGEVLKRNTHQGYNHESDWSRGQAWGLHGFTTAYRYTKNEEYLNQAIKIAVFILDNKNLPKDKIPYWDYDAPNIPDEPRDVSAATITASALYELSQYHSTNSKKYITAADEILLNLSSDSYKCDTPPFFLKHSVGSVPGEFEIDVPIIYADYFYVEALLRKKKIHS
jgi:hypothetical protein